MTAFGKTPRTPLAEALDELNDLMKGHSQYAVATEKNGQMHLVRVDTARPSRVLFLGTKEEIATERIDAVTEWEHENGGKR